MNKLDRILKVNCIVEVVVVVWEIVKWINKEKDMEVSMMKMMIWMITLVEVEEDLVISRVIKVK